MRTKLVAILYRGFIAQKSKKKINLKIVPSFGNTKVVKKKVEVLKPL